MYKYKFSGKIHPERVNFTIDQEIPSIVRLPRIGIKGEVVTKIHNSKIDVTFESETDHSKSRKCNLETLKNYIEDNVRIFVDIWCFVNSYCYDVEITKVECSDLCLNYVFPVRGEWNIKKNEQKASEEFARILKLFERDDSLVFKNALADFRRSIKYPSMTASYCFRAIETIRRFYFEDVNEKDESTRKKDGWNKLRKQFKLRKNEFYIVQKFALPNRHGDYPRISYKEREKIMNFTRKVFDGFIEYLAE